MRPTNRMVSPIAAVVLAASLAVSAAPAQPPAAATPPLSALWEEPHDVSARDLYNGPWGAENAPDPHAVYTFLRPKKRGVNPGVIVKDPLGRQWHVKQASSTSRHGAEGPVEVVLSRVLSAIGYHQPPVYYLPSFSMQNGAGKISSEPGGRFRLSEPRLKARGNWSWLNNPFANTQQLRGLLAILLTFNSSDLKSSNNTVYQVRNGDSVTSWFVVRDIGTALGETGRIGPHRNDVALFAKDPFVAGVADGFVKFNYHGLHKDILAGRISTSDVAWASGLLSQLSDHQWREAFRAGGYSPQVAAQFIRVIQSRIAEGQRLGTTTTTRRSAR